MGDAEVKTMENGENAGGETAEMDVKTFKSTPETALSGLRMPSNLTEARELLANLTVQYLAGAISQGTLRVSAYAINSLVKAMAAEKAQELERRVHALEKLRAAK